MIKIFIQNVNIYLDGDSIVRLIVIVLISVGKL